ncbi:PorT family protein [Cellulophaga baltica]|uniref:porin family protein n=1 Tax=Cellulophaga TaxID=104264 RepID=UPI001C06AC7B|nr:MULTISPECIES: porin family protein [Cellulophaga]MBU2997969.1 PorT family protein [Cellulophaga baltica]MDO6769370.1 porin family protein [Cellulophaga sp. 1_MG-2023]
MKKVVALLIFMTAGTSLFAQSWSDEFQLGVKAGANLSTVTGDDSSDPGHRTSFYAGLLAEAPITEKLSLQPEVFYSRQGFDINDNPNGSDTEYQLDYIQVPVLLKVYLVDGLNIQAGPQFGFKVNEDINIPGADDDIDVDGVEDFDFQLTSGLEYKIAQSVFIQARYTYGFSELVKDTDTHTSYFSAGIGYMF